MTKEQYELLNSICSTLNLLADIGNTTSGLSYNMGQTCGILCNLILNFIDDDAKQYLKTNNDR